MEFKKNGMPRFIVERCPRDREEGAGYTINTVEDLQQYLAWPAPHDDYRLVSTQLVNGTWILVWEYKDPPVVVSGYEIPGPR